MSVEALFKQATQLHQSGQLSQAETVYQEILRQFSGHPEAMRLIGVIRRQIWLVGVIVVAMIGVFGYLTSFGIQIISGKSAGFGSEFITPWTYLISQAVVILHYLRLSIWPHPLCLDYAWLPVTGFSQAIVPGLVILILLALTVWGLIRRSPLGFLGAWFFIVLAPTSSIVPLYDLVAEHRMYLPLICVVALVVMSAYIGVERLQRSSEITKPAVHGMSLAVALIIAATLAWLTVARNSDYARIRKSLTYHHIPRCAQTAKCSTRKDRSRPPRSDPHVRDLHRRTPPQTDQPEPAAQREHSRGHG